jgi:hypothetical protein
LLNRVHGRLTITMQAFLQGESSPSDGSSWLAQKMTGKDGIDGATVMPRLGRTNRSGSGFVQVVEKIFP